MSKPSIIFVCTGNACRSQMAEALMRNKATDRFDVYSAGSHPAGFVHPLAVEAMRELGIDIARGRSKGLDEFLDRTFDYVVTVCDHAAASCPTLQGRLGTLRWPLPDPCRIVEDSEMAIQAARRVRGELDRRIAEFLATAATPRSGSA